MRTFSRSFFESPRRRVFLFCILLLLAVAGFAGWGPIREAGAQIARYLYSDPDTGEMEGGANKEEFMARRSEAIALKRGLGNGRAVDPRLRIDAIRQMEAQEARMARTLAPQLTWSEIGPNPIPNGRVISGLSTAASGRTIAIAVHPTDPNIVYVGTAAGGLYRTLDGGATWVPMLDSALSLAIGAVAVAPSQPDTIFVGTGEPGLFNGTEGFFGVGIYRIDNASTVSPIITGPIGSDSFIGRSIGKIVVHPTDPNIIFASSIAGNGGIGGVTGNTVADRGLFRSTNALSAAPGFTKLVLSGASPQDRDVLDIVMDPGNPNLVLCTGVDSSNFGTGGVFRSTNALDLIPTFSRTFVANGGLGPSRTELALNRTGPNVTVFAASGFNGGTVQRSTDGGVTWTQQIANNFCGGQCYYDIAIDVDPTNSSRVYLGGDPTLVFGRSTDGGVTFTNNASTANGLHADSHVIAVSPSLPSTIYFGSDGGIYKSIDSGQNWSSLNNTTFKATEFWSIAAHPTDQKFTIGGTQDNGTNFYKQDGTWTRADFGDGGYAVIDQNAADTTNVRMYHTYFNQVVAGSSLVGYATVSNTTQAMDNGWTFRGCSSLGATGNGITCSGSTLFYAPLQHGPGNPNTIYFGTDRLYRSDDAGLTNILVSQNPISTGDPISAIGISDLNDDIRIVGLKSGGLWGTRIGSSTLTNLDPANTVPNQFIARAVIVPDNINTAYVTLSAFGQVAVWKTVDLNNATPTWAPADGTGINVLPKIPVSAFVIDPNNTSILFAGTDIGVYRSNDGGLNWLPFAEGLPRVPVFDMAITGGPNRKLRIATHGRGMWETLLSEPTPTPSPTPPPAGTVDGTFGKVKTHVPAGYYEGAASAVAVQADGKTIASGTTYNQNRSVGDFMTVRYNIDGSLDTSFGGSGIVTTSITAIDQAQAVAIQPDGKILVGGGTGFPGPEDSVVLRYNTNGTLDTGFGTAGIATTNVKTFDRTYSLAVQTDGKIIAFGTSGGSISSPDNTFSTIRLNADGSLDTSFGTGGNVQTRFSTANGGRGASVALQPDGKIVTGGSIMSDGIFTGLVGLGFGVMRYNPNGTLDTTFNGNGMSTIAFNNTTDARGTSAVLQRDGKIVLVGTVNVTVNSSTVQMFGTARFSLNGQPDATFGAGGTVTTVVSDLQSTTGATGAAVQKNGKIVAGGYAYNLNGDTRDDFELVRYNPNGSLDSGFATNGIAKIDFGGVQSYERAYAIALQRDGKIVMAGSNSFPPQFAVTRVNGDPVAPGATLFDYDADGKTDISVFRPAEGGWHIVNSQAGEFGMLFGVSDDKIAPADYDGDGKTDIAVYRPSNNVWYIYNSRDSTFSYYVYGLAEDLPTPADYDGDGKADLSVFRPSTGDWHRRNSRDGSFYDIHWGQTGDKPTVGDFDGDGKADLAVFRPSEAGWYQIRSADGAVFGEQFGLGSDTLAQADYDGDGKTDLAIYRPADHLWVFKNSADLSYAYAVFGLSTDIPTPGDFDGDGKADICVFRPSDGNWYRQNSSNAQFVAYTYGAPGDTPTMTAFRY